MHFERASGVLCHISSLPSFFGIGDLGPAAYDFVDFLVQTKQKYWQILPINPTDNALGNSPYSSYSAFAFNLLFISPELLCKDGFLSEDDVKEYRFYALTDVDYCGVTRAKIDMLLKAYRHYTQRNAKLSEFELFCKAQAFWLDDFALFVVLKKVFNDECWVDWPAEYKNRQADAIKSFLIAHEYEIEQEKFWQFLFFKQWMALQAHCSKNGVKILGDIPIYVNYDSADVWVHPESFKLDEQKRPTFVAGVPPDYFSKDGQRWGNPVYNWDMLKASNFDWWVKRLKHNLTIFDAVRIDHFRAFVQCWEIPAHEKTAVHGAWRDVPGQALFEALTKHFPKLPIIAEDLGIITDDVIALKEKFKFPGMCVLMFAFHGDYEKSRDLPENYTENCVVYTGTHDNNTVCGWYEKDVTPLEKSNMKDYFGSLPDIKEINWILIELALKSLANISIIPIQDLLCLKSDARMNKPSTVEGNWKWRLKIDKIPNNVRKKLKNLTTLSNR